MPCGSSYGHFSYFLRGSGAPQVLRYHLNIPDADVPIFGKIRHNFPLYRGENGANERLVKLLRRGSWVVRRSYTLTSERPFFGFWPSGKFKND